MPMVMVMLSGKIASGKTTTAIALFELLNAQNGRYAAYVSSSGLEAKRGFLALHKLQEDELTHRDKKENYRAAVIAYATSHRAKDPDVWVRDMWNNQVTRRMPMVINTWVDNMTTHKPVHVFVCDDFRFTNEADFVAERMKIVGDDRTLLLKVRLEASDESRRARGWIPIDYVDEHASERELDKYEWFDQIMSTDTFSTDEICKCIMEVLDEFAKAPIG